MSRVHVTGTFTAREVPWDLHILPARGGFGQTVLARAGKGYCPGDRYTILLFFFFLSGLSGSLDEDFVLSLIDERQSVLRAKVK